MRFFQAFCVALLPTAAVADISTDIAELGLSGARAKLEAQPSRSVDDQFALGGILFLEAVERAYGARWTYGFTGVTLPVPVLRTELPPNPNPEAFVPETMMQIMDRFVEDMNAVEEALSALPDDADPSFVLNLPDLWLDIDQNGERGENEGFSDLLTQSIMSRGQIMRLERELEGTPDMPDPRAATIRFDGSDVHWLAAYAQVLQGVGELVLAFDPTSEIAKVMAFQDAILEQQLTMLETLPADQVAGLRDLILRERPNLSDEEVDRLVAEMANRRINPGRPSPFGQFAQPVDVISIVIETLRHEPDPARIAKAQAHFLNMIEHNRDFWSSLDAETDNDREWIPNATQTAALGLELPGEIGPAWLAVLDDAEAILKGEALIPFWRFADGFGVDLNAYVADPGPVPIVEWIQGSAALPYARQGEVLDSNSWRQFRRMTRGQTGLLVILLN